MASARIACSAVNTVSATEDTAKYFCAEMEHRKFSVLDFLCWISAQEVQCIGFKSGNKKFGNHVQPNNGEKRTRQQ